MAKNNGTQSLNISNSKPANYDREAAKAWGKENFSDDQRLSFKAGAKKGQNYGAKKGYAKMADKAIKKGEIIDRNTGEILKVVPVSAVKAGFLKNGGNK